MRIRRSSPCVFLWSPTLESGSPCGLPRGRMGGRGIHPRVSSLVFETEAGEWVGEVPVFAAFRLQETAERDLKAMLEQAKQRGR